ncbi:unnamed protein product [Arabidopsis thaliana]|uniref:non-specific serine/threonine protein kinase n=1 Tax=Arabidopsis thaliana TaxID=3702 RepID=A0A7G2E5P0_ARATH|nr:unnamed protein product [Arabidopsis thaliana]
MALLSRIRSSTSLFRYLNASPQIRSLSSASTILSPDSKTPLTSKEKSKAALSLLKSEKDPDRILEICRAASLTPDCHIDRIAFSAAVENLAEKKHFSAVSNLLDGFIENRPDLKSERFAAHAIVLYAQANMLDHSLRVFRDLEKLEISRTVKSLNALLFACLVAKDYKEAKRVYIEMPKMYGIEPDLETYNRMIKVFCESGSASSSYSIVAEMERKGIKPNSSSFGLMISGFYAEDKSDEVGKVLAMMKDRGVNIGLTAYRGHSRKLFALFTFRSHRKGSCRQKYITEEIKKYGNVKNCGRIFKFKELIAATDNFSMDCMIGEGGFGRVYKGFLTSLNQVVAVKRLDRNGLQGTREFFAEVVVLSLAQHANLVNLIGYCVEDEQRVLVYEFMPNGSLEDHLFGKDFDLLMLYHQAFALRAIDGDRPTEEQNLISWAEPLLKDRRMFTQIVDPNLEGNYPVKGLHQALAIAAMCLQEEAETRPLMGDVVTALEFLAKPIEVVDNTNTTPASPTQTSSSDSSN